jgi:hypothetical protein
MRKSTRIDQILVRAGAIGALALGSLVVSGCTNLEAVKTYATVSASAIENPDVATDWARSPLLLRRFEPASRGEDLEALAKGRTERVRRMLAIQKIVAVYLRSIGALAGKTLPDAGTEVGALSSALSEGKFLGRGDSAAGTETVSAATAIAKLVTRLALDGWRQAALADVIREADPSIQTVVAGLSEVVRKDFGASFDLEWEAARKCFEAVRADAKSRELEDSVGRLAQVLEAETGDALEARKKKLTPFVGVLERIGKGHAVLAASSGKLDGEALGLNLAQIVKDLEVLDKSIRVLSR